MERSEKKYDFIRFMDFRANDKFLGLKHGMGVYSTLLLEFPNSALTQGMGVFTGGVLA